MLFWQWHALTREEQAKYYEMARKERQLHMQMYPGWSARDCYGTNIKKKRRKREKSLDDSKYRCSHPNPNPLCNVDRIPITFFHIILSYNCISLKKIIYFFCVDFE